MIISMMVGRIISLHVEQSIAAITGRQLRNRRVDRSSTISDDVGVRQGYLLGSALNSFGV